MAHATTSRQFRFLLISMASNRCIPQRGQNTVPSGIQLPQRWQTTMGAVRLPGRERETRGIIYPVSQRRQLKFGGLSFRLKHKSLGWAKCSYFLADQERYQAVEDIMFTRSNKYGATWSHSLHASNQVLTHLVLRLYLENVEGSDVLLHVFIHC